MEELGPGVLRLYQDKQKTRFRVNASRRKALIHLERRTKVWTHCPTFAKKPPI